MDEVGCDIALCEAVGECSCLGFRDRSARPLDGRTGEHLQGRAAAYHCPTDAVVEPARYGNVETKAHDQPPGRLSMARFRRFILRATVS